MKYLYRMLHTIEAFTSWCIDATSIQPEYLSAYMMSLCLAI